MSDVGLIYLFTLGSIPPPDQYPSPTHSFTNTYVWHHQLATINVKTTVLAVAGSRGEAMFSLFIVIPSMNNRWHTCWHSSNFSRQDHSYTLAWISSSMPELTGDGGHTSRMFSYTVLHIIWMPRMAVQKHIMLHAWKSCYKYFLVTASGTTCYKEYNPAKTSGEPPCPHRA